MKRGKPLPRGTKSLARTARLSRGTGLPRTERKRKAVRDTGPSAKVRAAVWARAGNACEACGTSLTGRPSSIQHRVARRMGGTSDPAANALSNLTLLCGSATTPGGCHALCEARDVHMRARGFWLYSWESAADAGVMLASEHGSGMTVWLSDDGRYLTEPPGELAA